MSRRFNIQSDVVFSGEVNGELDMLGRGCIDNVDRVSHSAARGRWIG